MMGKRMVMNIVIFGCVVLGCLWMCARYLERNSVFFPDRNLSVSPDDVGLNFETVWLESSDQVKIHGWYVPGRKEAGTLLFLHGNAGNISGRIGKLEQFHQLGLNVLIIDYRGYGLSEGDPSVEGLTLDAQAGYDYLVSQRGVPPEQIIIFGSSLGGVPALILAGNHLVGAVLLDSIFSSAKDMAKAIYPFIPSFLVSLKMDNMIAVNSVSAPKLFMHSRDDGVVPYSLGLKVFEEAKEPKTFLELRGDHVNAYVDDSQNYIQGITAFLDQHHLLGDK